MTARAHWAPLLAQYDLFLFDAYGVLVHGQGPIPGAAEALARLTAAEIPWRIVTNDASKLPAVAAARYQAWGLPVQERHVVSSGSLLPAWITAQGLDGCTAAVLGPPGCAAWLTERGCSVVAVEDASWDLLVICDESGFDFLHGMDTALSGLVTRIDTGRTPVVVTPNPDLIYTQGPDLLGFAAGTMAEMLIRALELRYGSCPTPFHYLGKPHAPIFEAALKGLEGRRAVMFGDQLRTDILGARQAGIDAVWVGSGVIGDLPEVERQRCEPTWWTPDLASL